jgi:hypothetical protein
MKVIRLLGRHPFVAMLLAGLALGAVVDWAGIQYDSSGIGSVFFYLSLLLAFPVWIAHEILSSSEFLRGIYVSKWVAIAFALVIAVGLDYLLHVVRKEFGHSK